MSYLFSVTLAMSQAGWEVSFTPRPNNVGVQLETACYHESRLSFIAIDYIHVEDTTDHLTFRRHDEAPRGDACAVKAFVFANDEKGDTFFGADPSGDYVIDSSGFVDQK